MTNKRKTIQIIFSLLTIALTLFIFWNSLKNGEESGMQSDFAVDGILRVLNVFGIQPDFYTLGTVIRKLAHFTEYFLLGLTATKLLSTFENKKFYPLSPIYCLIVAICDEFVMQRMTEGRAPMWTDVLIDMSGALTAFLLIVLWAKKEKQK